MARVKRCDVCGLVNPLVELFCSGCGSSLAFVPETAPESSLVPTPQAPAGGASPTVREAPAPHVRLLFPWGTVEVRHRLPIGRDPEFSSLADRLTPLDTVSRVHAEVFTEAGSVFVRHLSATNPTYVDGRALGAQEVAPLADGSQVAFSRSLIATVKVG